MPAPTPASGSIAPWPNCGPGPARSDWRALTGPAPRELPGLPTYPFQRQRHWLPDPGTVESGPLPGTPAPATSTVARDVTGTGAMATGPVGTGPVEGGRVEPGPLDTGPLGAGPVESGTVESGPVESGTVESGTVQTGSDEVAGVNGPAQWSEIVQQLLDTPLEQRRAVLFSHVQREVASVIGLQSPDLLAADQGLFDLGVDSLMAVDLARRLERALGRPLPTTLAIDHPTVDALTDRLLELGMSLHLFHRASGAPAPATNVRRRADRNCRDGLPFPRRGR